MAAHHSDETSEFVQLLESVTPEQSNRLRDVVNKLRLTILLDEAADEIRFQADSAANRIVVGRKCLLRLRAHANAYACCQAARGMLLNPEKRDELLRPASRMLTWAVARDLQIALSRRGCALELHQIMMGGEAELPCEIHSQMPEDCRRVAQSLWRNALAYILYHEMVHLELRDVGRNGFPSVEQEKQADRIAAQWMLDSPDLPGGTRLIRLSGIAVALMWVASLNVYLGARESRRHPSGYDRLYQTVNQSVTEIDDEESGAVWEFLALSLFVHVDTGKLPYEPERLNGTYKEISTYLIDVISRTAL